LALGKEWIKLHVDKWLDGSTRHELTPAERSVWIDLLALAGRYDKEGKREGVIPIPKQSLCRIMMVHPTIFDRAIDKFLKYDKIAILGDGSIKITNWNHYQPSRWEIWASKNPDKATTNRHKHPQTLTNNTQTQEGDRDREKELDIITSSLEDVVNWVKGQEWYPAFKADYPHFKDSDLLSALQWLRSKGKRVKLLNRFLINWAKKIPPPPSKGRVPEKYTDPDEL